MRDDGNDPPKDGDDNDHKPPNFVRSLDTEAILQRLIRATRDDPYVTYKEASGIIGRDVQQEARYVLDSARRAAERDYGMVFGVEQNVGLKLLTDEETVQAALKPIEHTRRTARRTARMLTTVDYDKLSPESQLTHNTRLSQLGVLIHAASSKGMKRLAEGVRAAGRTLSLDATLEHFKRK